MKHVSIALFIGLALVQLATAADKPNFIILFADDLGYGDLSCYGSQTIRTPRIDRMAADGIRFTDFYATAPFCSPSRASLLTGRYPARCGVPNVLFPVEKTGLPAEEVTIAEILKLRGYATACIGKWHLGMEKPFHPNSQGFDLYYGIPHSNDSHWPEGTPFKPHYAPYDLPLIENDRVIEAPVDQDTLTRRYTERAVQFIRENRNRPFFVYLPHTFPHKPQHASPAFEGKSAAGLYGDCVEELDWSVGQILDELRGLKIADRTLVVFTSDNGPAASGIGKRHNSFGRRGGGGSARPLRGGKGQTYEGGMRVPAIFWWPDTIKPKQQSGIVASILDLLPTCAALAGADLPRDRMIDGADITPILMGEADERVMRALADRPFCYYFGEQLQALRQGKWKLFLQITERPQQVPLSLWYQVSPQTFERQYRLQPQAVLYDLSHDIAEQHNVAASHADIVTQLTAAARDFDRELQAGKQKPIYLEPPKPPFR